MKKPNDWLKDEYFKGGDWVPFDMDEAMQKYAKYYASQSQDTITPQMTIAEQQDTIGQLKTQITFLLSEVKRLTAEKPSLDLDKLEKNLDEALERDFPDKEESGVMFIDKNGFHKIEPDIAEITDEDNALDEWWRELTRRQIDFILLKIG